MKVRKCNIYSGKGVAVSTERERGARISENKNIRQEPGNGKLFAVWNASEIKRIHAARIRLTSIVWKMPRCEEGRGREPPRNPRLDVPCAARERGGGCNIFQRATHTYTPTVRYSGGCATFCRTPLTVCARLYVLPSLPLNRALLSREEFFDTYLLYTSRGNVSPTTAWISFARFREIPLGRVYAYIYICACVCMCVFGAR